MVAEALAVGLDDIGELAHRGLPLELSNVVIYSRSHNVADLGLSWNRLC